MYPTRINMNLLKLKLHYILYLGGVSFIQGLWQTIAKQLGYSPMVVGYLYTYLSILDFLVKPMAGYVVDKLPVKRLMFLAAVLASGVMGFSLIFVQKLPIEAVVNLSCDTTSAVLNVCSNINNTSLPQCDDSLPEITINDTEPVLCRLYCQQNEPFREEMCKSWLFTDYCTPVNITVRNNDQDFMNALLFINKTNQVEKNSVFQIKSLQINETRVLMPVCQKLVMTRCNVECSNDVVTELVSVPKYEGSILGLHQFWLFFFVISFYWISQAVTWSLQDPICFDILDDKPEDFGKQRCWGSISWGLCSIFGGALIDHFSTNNFHKNYTPVYCLCLIIIIADFSIASKIKIPETTACKNTFSSILKLLTQWKVIVYFTWIVGMGICTAIPWNYLFWYMEEITSKHHSDKLPWMKTIQGVATGIQCIGELPFLFFSGWIIKRVGHWYCMTLGFLVYSIRFYLYSVITNPLWILPVELFNGITYGLCHAVLIAYARIIAPPSTATTLVGFSGALFEGVGTSLGGFISGFLYENYGGAWAFKIFSYGSFLMFILHASFTKLSKSNEYEVAKL